jgi:hypothetical protein
VTRSTARARSGNAGIARWEWAAVAAILVVCGAFVWYQTQHYWFRSDDWLFLSQRATSIRDLIGPHGGHFTAAALVAYKAMLAVFGMRQYPPYVAFRVVGFSLMVLALWWIMRRRGADPLLSLAVAAGLGVLSSSVENKVVSVGIYLAVPAILLAFLFVDEHPQPTLRRRLLVALLLGVALVANTLGDIGIVALTVMVALSARHRRSWLPLCAAYTLLFAIWSIVYRSRIVSPEPRHRNVLRKALDLPVDVFRLARSTIEQLTFPGTGIGVVILVALVAVIGRAAWQRRLGLFELAAIATVVLAFAANSLNRMHTTLASFDTLRYADPIALFLVPALLPLARPRSWLVRGFAIALVLAVAVAQANEFANEADTLTLYANAERLRTTAARQLIVNGEPFVRQSRGLAEVANDDIARLADAQGWAAAQPSRLEAARGRLRIGIAAPGRPVLTNQPDAAPLLPGGRPLRGCVPVRANESSELTLEAGHSASITLRPASRGIARTMLRTRDHYGSGVRAVPVDAPTDVSIVTPDTGLARLSVRPTGAAVRVCAAPR